MAKDYEIKKDNFRTLEVSQVGHGALGSGACGQASVDTYLPMFQCREVAVSISFDLFRWHFPFVGVPEAHRSIVR